MLEPPEIAITSQGETHLAYQVAGSGPPDVVFVAGAVAMTVAWEDTLSSRCLRRMSSFGRLVTYDQRGLGLSDRVAPDGTLTMDDLVADLEAVIDASGVEDPVLFGMHNGGAVAALYATRHPVRQLVLCNTWARLAKGEDFEIGFPERVLDRMQARYETEWGAGRIVADYADRGSRAESRRIELASTSFNQHVPLFRLNRTYDVRAALAAVDVDTLVIHMEDNAMVPAVHGLFIADSIPGARLVLLPGSDHIFLRNHGDAVVDEVEQFVTGRSTPYSDRLQTVMVFTDIVDSTALAAALGDSAWSARIDDHNARVLRLVEDMGGHGIKSTGDGFLVAFDDAPTAVRFARAAIGAVVDLGLSVRAGVHVGEVARMGNRDFSGLAVHFAQRLCAQAEGGQLLVSEPVRVACEGSDVVFASSGKARFKGVPGEWEVFEARL